MKKTKMSLFVCMFVVGSKVKKMVLEEGQGSKNILCLGFKGHKNMVKGSMLEFQPIRLQHAGDFFNQIFSIWNFSQSGFSMLGICPNPVFFSLGFQPVKFFWRWNFSQSGFRMLGFFPLRF